jgi:hypothetical protein
MPLVRLFCALLASTVLFFSSRAAPQGEAGNCLFQRNVKESETTIAGNPDSPLLMNKTKMRWDALPESVTHINARTYISDWRNEYPFPSATPALNVTENKLDLSSTEKNDAAWDISLLLTTQQLRWAILGLGVVAFLCCCCLCCRQGSAIPRRESHTSHATPHDCEWMFGDAATGLFGVHNMADLNPLRWSGALTIDKAIEQLQRVQEHGNRPIILKVPANTKSKDEHKCDTVEQAIAYLRAQKSTSVPNSRDCM